MNFPLVLLIPSSIALDFEPFTPLLYGILPLLSPPPPSVYAPLS